jgi:hypothetical protein
MCYELLVEFLGPASMSESGRLYSEKIVSSATSKRLVGLKAA